MCFGLIVALTACAGGGGGLRDLRSNGSGPDEFSVMPARVLVLPDNVTNLPEPTSGESNRTDPTPNADVVAILGGNPNALISNGIPVSDDALMSVVNRNGVDPKIRQTLAAEDAKFRLRQMRFGFVRGQNRYFSAYARQALNAYSELRRFRNAGIVTPTAPPQ